MKSIFIAICSVLIGLATLFPPILSSPIRWGCLFKLHLGAGTFSGVFAGDIFWSKLIAEYILIIALGISMYYCLKIYIEIMSKIKSKTQMADNSSRRFSRKSWRNANELVRQREEEYKAHPKSPEEQAIPKTEQEYIDEILELMNKNGLKRQVEQKKAVDKR